MAGKTECDMGNPGLPPCCGPVRGDMRSRCRVRIGAKCPVPGRGHPALCLPTPGRRRADPVLRRIHGHLPARGHDRGAAGLTTTCAPSPTACRCRGRAAPERMAGVGLVRSGTSMSPTECVDRPRSGVRGTSSTHRGQRISPQRRVRSADLKRCSLLMSGNVGAGPGPGERELPSDGSATVGRDRCYRGVRGLAASGKPTPVAGDGCRASATWSG
jgi:hypothetical protein